MGFSKKCLFSFAGFAALSFGTLSAISSQSSVRAVGSRRFLANDAGAVTFDEGNYVDVRSEDNGISMTINSASHSDVCQSYNLSIEVTDSSDCYYIGNYGEGNEFLPLTFYFDVKDADGNTKTRMQEMQKVSIAASYDGVGKNAFGRNDFTINVDLLMDSGETVLTDTLKAVNIFRADTSGVHAAIDLSKNYYLGSPIVGSKIVNYDVAEFLDMDYRGTTAFTGYTTINCSYESLVNEAYAKYSSRYSRVKAKLESGEYQMRAQFNSLTSTSTDVFLKDGTQVEAPVTGSSSLILKNRGKLNFLISGFSAGDVDYFCLKGVNLYIDVIDVGTTKAVTRSAFSVRFGYVNFRAKGSVKKLDFNLILGLTLLGYAVLYVVAAYGLFVYRSRKYRNDEFRRVVPKHFIKRSLIFFGFTAGWLAEIILLAGRAGGMSNSFIVYNPFDIWIVVFSIALIIYSGYYIKFAITTCKDWLKKRRDRKLKVNEDVADDGTVNLDTRKAGN